MSPVETILQDCGVAAGIGFWRYDSKRGMIHWPRGFGPARDDSYGAWWPLGELGASFAPDVRVRLFDYFEHLFEPQRAGVAIELPVTMNGSVIQLRIEGQPLKNREMGLAAGLVRNITRRHDAEYKLKNMTLILDSVMISASSGIIVLDSQRQVRKANQKALRCFGIDPGDAQEQGYYKGLEARMPKLLLVEITDCQLSRTAISGVIEPEGILKTGIKWRANPWGRAGVILIVDPVLALAASTSAPEPAFGKPGRAGMATTGIGAVAAAAAQPEQPKQPDLEFDRSRALLEYVHHPCLIIQSRDASIDYANRQAREKLGLRDKVHYHLKNLFEISGRHAPHNVYVTPDRYQHLITLPMGARVARMVDIDPDLLFVEYT